MLLSSNWKSYPSPPTHTHTHKAMALRRSCVIGSSHGDRPQGFISWRLSSNLSLDLNGNGHHSPNLPIQWQLQINKMLAESGMVLVYRVELFCVGNLRRLLMRKEMLVKLRNRKLHVWKRALGQRKRSFKRKWTKNFKSSQICLSSLKYTRKTLMPWKWSSVRWNVRIDLASQCVTWTMFFTWSSCGLLPKFKSAEPRFCHLVTNMQSFHLPLSQHRLNFPNNSQALNTKGYAYVFSLN